MDEIVQYNPSGRQLLKYLLTMLKVKFGTGLNSRCVGPLGFCATLPIIYAGTAATILKC